MWLRNSPCKLILLRVVLLCVIVALIVFNLIRYGEENLDFTVFNLYISLLVSILQVFSILKYKNNLKKFKLDLIISKDRAMTMLLGRNQTIVAK